MNRFLVITGITAALGAVFFARVLRTRHDANVRMESARLASRARPSHPPGGGDENAVKILQFYATSGVVIEGRRGIVCYGVQNAKSVRMEPAVEDVYPAFSRCFWVEPRQDTTYTLVARGFDGREVSESFTVRVKPAPPSILFVAVSDKEVRKGEPLTVCYGVAHADTVRLQPLGLNLRPAPQDCTRFYPAATMKYTLVASGANGPADRQSFTVKVR